MEIDLPTHETKKITPFNGEYPFENFLVYGPTFHKKEKRYFYFLVPSVKTSSLNRTTISVARYKMSVFLKRTLLASEEVDHKDNIKINDDINNLQILSKQENTKKSAKKPIMYPSYSVDIWRTNYASL